MRPFVAPSLRLSLLLAVLALGWPEIARSEVFSANYGLSPRTAPEVNFGPVRISPILQSEARYSGAGLSVDAGRDWFARVGVGRQLLVAGGSAGAASAPVLSIVGGYRLDNGQSLSLQLSRGAQERLGLSINYEWPRYFVRLSYDTMLAPLPQDSLRFSAGVRF